MKPDRIKIIKDLQYYKFCGYGFFKNLRLFEPFLILFFLENGLSFLQIGFLYSFREITRNILEIPAGIISDSLGRKRTMLFSFGMYIISFSIFYTGNSYSFFFAAMLFYALGDAFRTGTHKAMIFDYLKIQGNSHHKTHYYGHTRSYSQLGSAISSIIGGLFVFFSGNFRDIFIFTTIPYLFNFILISTYPKSLDGMRSRFDKQKLKTNVNQVIRGFIVSFKNVTLLKAMGNLSIHTGYYRAIKDYLQPVLQMLALSIPVFVWLEETRRTAVVVGVVYFIIYLMTSYASRKSGRFREKFASYRFPLYITYLAGFGFGLFSGILLTSDLLVLSVVLFIGIYIIENLRKPIGIANIADRSQDDILATILSTESQLHSFFAAIFAPLIGYVADTSGLGMAIALVSIIGLLMLNIVDQRRGKK